MNAIVHVAAAAIRWSGLIPGFSTTTLNVRNSTFGEILLLEQARIHRKRLLDGYMCKKCAEEIQVGSRSSKHVRIRFGAHVVVPRLTQYQAPHQGDRLSNCLFTIGI